MLSDPIHIGICGGAIGDRNRLTLAITRSLVGAGLTMARADKLAPVQVGYVPSPEPAAPGSLQDVAEWQIASWSAREIAAGRHSQVVLSITTPYESIARRSVHSSNPSESENAEMMQLLVEIATLHDRYDVLLVLATDPAELVADSQTRLRVQSDRRLRELLIRAAVSHVLVEPGAEREAIAMAVAVAAGEAPRRVSPADGGPTSPASNATGEPNSVPCVGLAGAPTQEKYALVADLQTQLRDVGVTICRTPTVLDRVRALGLQPLAPRSIEWIITAGVASELALMYRKATTPLLHPIVLTTQTSYDALARYITHIQRMKADVPAHQLNRLVQLARIHDRYDLLLATQGYEPSRPTPSDLTIPVRDSTLRRLLKAEQVDHQVVPFGDAVYALKGVFAEVERLSPHGAV